MYQNKLLQQGALEKSSSSLYTIIKMTALESGQQSTKRIETTSCCIALWRAALAGEKVRQCVQ